MSQQTITLKRTLTGTNPAPATLAVGELALGLGATPRRLWVGTPTGVQDLLTALGGPYLPLTGGTLTGDLTISKNSPAIILAKTADTQQNIIWGRNASSNRWAMRFGNTVAESGANAGSNFDILRYDDAGVSLGVAFSLDRATGMGNFTNGLNNLLSINRANSGLILNKLASGQTAYVDGRTNNVNRWRIEVGNGTAESGSNAGSNFSIARYDDAGASLGAVLSIARNTGLGTVTGDPTASLGIATKQYVDANTKQAIVSVTAPASPRAGQLWFRSDIGQLFVWYVDPDTSQWVVANTSPAQERRDLVTVSETAPANPVSGQLWFRSSTGQLFIWYVDLNTAQWVSPTSATPS